MKDTSTKKDEIEIDNITEMEEDDKDEMEEDDKDEMHNTKEKMMDVISKYKQLSPKELLKLRIYNKSL